MNADLTCVLATGALALIIFTLVYVKEKQVSATFSRIFGLIVIVIVVVVLGGRAWIRDARQCCEDCWIHASRYACGLPRRAPRPRRRHQAAARGDSRTTDQRTEPTIRVLSTRSSRSLLASRAGHACVTRLAASATHLMRSTRDKEIRTTRVAALADEVRAAAARRAPIQRLCVPPRPPRRTAQLVGKELTEVSSTSTAAADAVPGDLSPLSKLQ